MPEMLSSVYSLRKTKAVPCPHCQASIIVHPRFVLAARLAIAGVVLAGILDKLGTPTTTALAPIIGSAAVLGFTFAWFAGRYHAVE
jgi:hypothetical protein